VAFDDLEARDRLGRETLSDPELVQAFAASEKDGPLNARMTNTFMRPTAYSPLQ
jgi:hypothetical protein